MRTTVRLPDELLKRAKEKAAREGTTLTDLLERGLRMVVSQRPRASGKRIYPRVSSVAGRQLIDVTKTSEVLEFLDKELPIEKRR